MKAASVKEIKTELSERSPKELMELCLRLSKFKKENKELLTYLLFEADNEKGYIASVKVDIDEKFEQINKSRYYFIKKALRKILRETKKYIRYSKKKETEIDLLLYFCTKVKHFKPSIRGNIVIMNMYNNQIKRVEKIVSSLHEDLQYDYGLEIEELRKPIQHS